jgi:ABC-type amino acid transport substrate-binding protein
MVFLRPCVCLIAAAALAAAAPGGAVGQTLRSIAQAGTPVKYAGADSRLPGLCRELAQAVQRFDSQLQVQGLDKEAPLRRVEVLLERGEIDLFFCMIDTPARRARFDFLSVPIYQTRHVVVQRSADRRAVDSYARLAEIGRRSPVLVAQGSALARHLARQGVAHVEGAPSDLLGLRMLMLDRAEVLYGQDMTLAPLLRLPEFAGRLRISGRALAADSHFVAVSRQLPGATRNRLETALSALERNGTLRELSERYRQP